MNKGLGREDLYIWKDVRNLVKEVYYTSRKIKNKGFIDNIRRTVLMVLANVSEAFGQEKTEDFHIYIHKAALNCNEVKNMMYIARYRNYISDDDLDNFLMMYNDMIVSVYSVFLNKQSCNIEQEQSDILTPF